MRALGLVGGDSVVLFETGVGGGRRLGRWLKSVQVGI